MLSRQKKVLALGMAGMLVLGIDSGLWAQEMEITGEELLILDIPVVIASKKEEKLSDAPGVITVVTKDELKRFGGTTLKDVLERVPSLIGSTVYMTDRSIISARGDQFKHSGSHVLLLLNGRPVREILEGGIKSEILESFPVNIVERIEVIRGPGSVLYGSGAFTAVINIVTEKADKNDVTVTGLGGVPSAYGAQGEAKYRFGDFSIVAAGRYHQKPDWEASLEFVDGPGTSVVSKEMTIVNRGPGAYVEINYKDLRLMSSFTQWENMHFAPHRTGPPFNFEAYGTDDTWRKIFSDLGYGLQVNEKWNMDINVTWTHSKLEVPEWPGITRKSYDLVAELTNFVNPIEKLGIVLGGLYNYNRGEEYTETMTINDGSRKSFAFYTQADYWPHQNIKLISGVQANKVENIDLDVVPRAGLILYPLSNVNIKAFYSQAFRAPTINELDIDFPTLQGNPNLKSEKVHTVDAGVNYLGEKIQAGVNYFYSKQLDVIFQDRSVTPATYNNIGEIEHQGVELEGKYYINKELFLTGSMLYQINKDKEGTENVTPIANLGVKAGISYKSEKGATVSLFNIYQGDLDDKFDTVENPSPGAYNMMSLHCQFDVFKLFDLDLKQDLSLLLHIDNLLDKELWLPNWGIPLGYSIPVDQGRTIYFGLEVSL